MRPRPQRVVIVGAAGRDFHNFNVAYRHDPTVEVVAFTAAQIPGIDDRVFPASLAGPRYPQGIPIRPEHELVRLIGEHDVHEVALAYSDLAHADVMHLAIAEEWLRQMLEQGADLVEGEP